MKVATLVAPEELVLTDSVVQSAVSYPVIDHGAFGFDDSVAFDINNNGD